MKPDLDELLRQMNTPDPASRAALDRARTAVTEELARKRPVRAWRTEVRRIIAAVWGLALLAALLGVWQGLSAPEVLRARAPLMLAMLVSGGLCIVASLSPRATLRDRWVAAAAAALTSLWLVAARLPEAPASGFPEWGCTVSHVGAALLPLLLAWSALRKTAPHPLRTVLVGAGVGTTGALIGELACAQDRGHVALYHLGAWLAVIAAAWLLGRFTQRTAFAP